MAETMTTSTKTKEKMKTTTSMKNRMPKYYLNISISQSSQPYNQTTNQVSQQQMPVQQP